MLYACGADLPRAATNGGFDDFEGGIRGGLANPGGNVVETGFRVDDQQDAGAGAAERDSQDAASAGEREQQGEHGASLHAVGLVQAVLHGDAEEVATTEGEGGDEQTGALDVEDGIGAAVRSGQKGASALGRETRGGKREE